MVGHGILPCRFVLRFLLWIQDELSMDLSISRKKLRKYLRSNFWTWIFSPDVTSLKVVHIHDQPLSGSLVFSTRPLHNIHSHTLLSHHGFHPLLSLSLPARQLNNRPSPLLGTPTLFPQRTRSWLQLPHIHCTLHQHGLTQEKRSRMSRPPFIHPRCPRRSFLCLVAICQCHHTCPSFSLTTMPARLLPSSSWHHLARGGGSHALV